MSDLYKKIMELCAQRKITGYRLCKDIGITPSVITDLKMGRKEGMSAKNANKIASYFGVSVGYLLGTETEKAPDKSASKDVLDEVDVAFYGEYQELDDDQKETVRDMVRVMRERQKKKQEN